ncbi:Gfo/Idh/MocA family protein [Paradevosia shaoguanensis]|uniref:Gfo/Idh/MocA family oxidoreductase n=1 Tax=Paradevosia shaoguanensis TaxID=1335043 RepID=A0AA41QM37_9HYPH|nr:Gfo/Idh/MocA family oxidoreductase [Paradevosia shaoguanensis]MCF1742209.1 Gfo/Idh/MocA family oxidoreductase [Paradevosia shaoguanensis]MCI0126692.1 Gfo/Idh/MocA family oxidoreductase [Paradevosia shaoguanensis]
MNPLPYGDKKLRLAMLGMVEGNGHPYSWSIIINGRYEADALSRCPYPAIRDYIGKQPLHTLGIPGAEVTHVWTDNPDEAPMVAKVAGIANVVARPEDVIGQVDAVFVATDKGEEHVERCRPFVEAGIPIFVDKPLCIGRDDLATFERWIAEGKPIISSSAMRYCKEFQPYHRSTYEFGDLRLVTVTMAKSWEAYGIHALEAMYPILGPGFVSVQNIGDGGSNIVHLRHKDGVDVVLTVIPDLYGGFGLVTLAGTKANTQLKFFDNYYSFKTQLESFIDYLRTGQPPVPWTETRELMQLVIAGIESRRQGGRKVLLSELEQPA